MPPDDPQPLKQKLAHAPTGPGIYLMKDSDGAVLYVGKALNLRKRLASYFKSPPPGQPRRIKTEALVRKIADFDTVVTANENEALILESNLIKRHRPRYNVVLKDDKRYPSIRLASSEPYPGLSIVRKIGRRDGGRYFGPFASAAAVHQTLRVIHKTFKLRKCKLTTFRNRQRPCLQYQMGRCLAPCCLPVAEEIYGQIVNEVVLFLKGRTPELVRRIRSEMNAAAGAQDFEKAAALRDKMFALERVLQRQVAVTTDFKDRDVVAVAQGEERGVVTLLNVRGGFLLGSRHFSIGETLSDDGEVTEAFLRQYYRRQVFVPPEILVPAALADPRPVENWLTGAAGRRVRILHPRRGEKVELLNTARNNAIKELAERERAAQSRTDVLQRLQSRLRSDRLPRRIECFDNSNWMGSQPVAAMAVFVDGRPEPSAYRRYGIRTVTGSDDYASMAEVLHRRYGKAGGREVLPDLLLVDGGKGQLNIALAVLRELGLEKAFPVAGIAKKDPDRGESEDKIYQAGRANPLAMGRGKEVLLLLQHIRDEAHRFALAFHRQRRKSTASHSALDAIPGIGPKRKAELLKYYKSIKNIKKASLEELSRLPGMTLPVAEALKAGLQD